MEPRYTCPCCGREFKITKDGVIIAINAIEDKQPDERIAQAIAKRNLEFGVTGGENG